jgi:hypothetical protein
VAETISTPIIRFSAFEVDLKAVVTREELRKALPKTPSSISSTV